MAIARIGLLAISMVLLSSVAMAADYTVGDDKGWALDFNYTQWAQDKVFHVGDNLWFKYDNSKHNVLKVDGPAFKDCNTSAANGAPLSSGNDMVMLSTPGKKWYICGFGNHCASHQMKIVIDVAADGPAPPPSAAHSLVSSLPGIVVAAVVAVGAIFA